jgi:uncharacterized protein with PIN domain
MKFLCDRMLGTLAKWLRIYGFDTFYANNEFNDAKLLEISKNEGCILITRDKTLNQVARRENIKTIEIKTTDIDEQINAVLGEVKVDKTKILSRCILCNTEVEEIKKKDAKEKVPGRVFKNNEKFWLCPRCNKIYWMGTHTDEMIKKIKKIRELRKHPGL